MALCPFLHAHYKFNSSSGLIATDSSPNGYDGTLVNMEGNEWVAGKLNNCLDFNAYGEHVNCGNIAAFGKNDAFSFEFWMNTSSGTNYQCMISKFQVAWNGYQVFTHNNRIDVYFMVTGGGQLHFRSTVAVNDGAWHHVVVTYDGSGLVAGCNIYVDNVNVTFRYADTITGGDFLNAGNFQISCRLGNGNRFEGKMDEVVIYTKELSVADVAERWNGGAGTETISGNPPNAPSNPNPTDTEADVEYNRDLSWDCTHPDGTSMTYDVYFDTVDPPVDKVSTDQVLKTYDTGDMDSLETYYWKIVARDVCGNETASPVWEFTTRNEPPITPHSPNPNNNATSIGISGVTLSWNSGDYNPNDVSTLKYDIYFGTNSNPPLIKTNHTTTSYTLTPLNYSTKYYWKIIVKDQHGASTASPVWNFTTTDEGLLGKTTYDPRENVRQALGRSKYDFDREETIYYLTVTDNESRDVTIPIYFEEEVKSRVQPDMPYISLKLANVIYEPHNVSASVRKMIAYIDIDVIYIATSNINIIDFGKAIKDDLYDRIRSYQEEVTNVFFMNIENDRYIEEEDGRQVVFHYILTLMCENHDLC